MSLIAYLTNEQIIAPRFSTLHMWNWLNQIVLGNQSVLPTLPNY